ncbi:MAG: alpha/beta hydrolase [Burkholderiales bacterium]|nr:alpha/beta hydrolase [Burkholderiales bacterium]
MPHLPTPPAPGLPPPALRPGLPLRAADLRGLARLAVDGVLGVTDVVEAMHHTIARRPAPLGKAPSGRPGGITGFVYRAVRGGTRVVGTGLDTLLGALPLDRTATTPQREALIAALNGVFGDHLADSGNPLAIPMQWRVGGQPLQQPPADASDRVLLLVHGLAMNDLQWQRHGHDHGTALAQALGHTPVWLHYNTGRHISQNGRELADQLDALLAAWPVPVRELAIVGHSMGGLVARSACHVGEGRPWRRVLRHLACLGSPHHGAPLERSGRLADLALGLSPYAAPLARLGMARSAGITDLRFGNLQDADWQQHPHRHRQHHDDRHPTPLPKGVNVWLVAATRSAHTDLARLRGDGLVPVASALGEHTDPARSLGVPASHRLVVPRAGHFDLLDHPEVFAHLRDWLR